MKFRQLLRNFLQVSMDKYPGHFFDENAKNDGEAKFSKTQSENENQHFFAKDFQILSNLSQELNRQTKNAGDQFTPIAAPPDNPLQSDFGIPENAMPSEFSFNFVSKNDHSPSLFLDHNFPIESHTPFEKVSTFEGIAHGKFYNSRVQQSSKNQISTGKNISPKK
jgi:hypothetical protein